MTSAAPHRTTTHKLAVRILFTFAAFAAMLALGLTVPGRALATTCPYVVQKGGTVGVGGVTHTSIQSAITDVGLPNPGPCTITVKVPVGGGNYTENVTVTTKNTLATSDAQRITLVAEAGVTNAPTIGVAFTFNGSPSVSKYITLDGFAASAPTTSPVMNIASGSFLTFTNMSISGGSFGITMPSGAISDIVIDGNDISGASAATGLTTGFGINGGTTVARVTVSNNTIHGHAKRGISFIGSVTGGHVIDGNIVRDNGTLAACASSTSECPAIALGADPNVVVVNNLIHDNTGTGVAFLIAGGTKFFVNNTIFQNTGHGVSSLRNSAVHLVNNLIAFNTACGIERGASLATDLFNAQAIVAMGNMLYRNTTADLCGNSVAANGPGNILDASDGTNYSTAVLTGNGKSTLCTFPVGTSTCDAPTHAAGELFDTGTFKLVGGSPAIDNGVNSYMVSATEYVPIDDFEGDARPQDGTVDIGWDESSPVQAKLTVTKTLVPSGDAGRFNLQIDGVTAGTGGNVGNGGTTGAVDLSAGPHTVSEAAVAGTSLTDYDTVIGGDCAADGTITLAAGDNKTCTITNTRKPRLTVTKTLAPSGDPGKFNLQIDGVTKAADVGNGGTTGAVTLSTGPHTVGETAGAGTDLANYTTVIGGDCAADGTITLAAGDNKTCTITNTRKATLTVTKTLVPSGDPGLFNLQIDSITAGTGADVGNGGTTGAVSLAAGPHTVGETAGTGTSLANYTTVIGGDCAANGAITLAAGESKTCTVTNTLKATLTVTKALVPSGDSGLFNLQIDGATAGTGANVGNGGTTGVVSLGAGPHTVSETAGTGTSLANYTTLIGGDCAANGSITLAAGESKACTITNTRQPTLTVTKTLAPSGAAGLFNLQIDGATAGTGANVGNGGTTGAVTVSIGPHTVGETAGTGTNLANYTTVIGGDCAVDGTITLAAGDTKTCTITNTANAPTLTVTKVVVDDTVGRFSLKINGTTYATNVGNGGSTGAQIANIGANTFGEVGGTSPVTSLGDYVTTITGTGCTDNGNGTGSITLAAGESKTCTITNTKIGRLVVSKVTVPSDTTVGFSITASGTGAVTAPATQTVKTGTPVTYTVAAGTYSVAEAPTSGWVQTGNTCSGIVVAAGATATCTVTNTKASVLVTSIAGTASQVGKGGGSQIDIAENFTFPSTFNLATSMLTVHAVLAEMGGAGELLKGVPLTLTAATGSRPDSAIFVTPSGAKPAYRFEVKIQDPQKNTWTAHLKVDFGVISKYPKLCSAVPNTTNQRATTLITTFSVNPAGGATPMVVPVQTSWRCLDPVGGDLTKPASLRTPVP